MFSVLWIPGLGNILPVQHQLKCVRKQSPETTGSLRWFGKFFVLWVPGLGKILKNPSFVYLIVFEDNSRKNWLTSLIWHAFVLWNPGLGEILKKHFFLYLTVLGNNSRTNLLTEIICQVCCIMDSRAWGKYWCFVYLNVLEDNVRKNWLTEFFWQVYVLWISGLGKIFKDQWFCVPKCVWKQ